VNSGKRVISKIAHQQWELQRNATLRTLLPRRLEEVRQEILTFLKANPLIAAEFCDAMKTVMEKTA
jgi:hypothetical protein